MLDREEVEAELVALEQFVVGVAAPPAFRIVLAPGGFALVHAALRPR